MAVTDARNGSGKARARSRSMMPAPQQNIRALAKSSATFSAAHTFSVQDTDAINVATVLASQITSGSPIPGFSTPTDSATIQCIVFGAIFEPGAAGATQTDSVNLMQSISTLGGTVFPSSASDPTNGYKWCIGTLAQRQQKLQQAFTTVMDEEISIILVPNLTP